MPVPNIHDTTTTPLACTVSYFVGETEKERQFRTVAGAYYHIANTLAKEYPGVLFTLTDGKPPARPSLWDWVFVEVEGTNEFTYRIVGDPVLGRPPSPIFSIREEAENTARKIAAMFDVPFVITAPTAWGVSVPRSALAKEG